MSLKQENKDIANIHVFGVPNLKKCSYEEYNLLFDNNFDISSFLDDSMLLCNSDKSINNLLKLLPKHNYKDVYLKLTIGLSLTLFMASNPILCFALSSNDNFFRKAIEQLGSDVLDGVSIGAIKGVLVVTALRLFVEYTRGGSKYKFFDIVKQCIIVLLGIIILPLLPGIVSLIVNNYLQY